MKKNIFQTILYVVMVSVISSCVEEYDPELPSSNELLVVNGRIVQQGTSVINLSLTSPVSADDYDEKTDFTKLYEVVFKIKEEDNSGYRILDIYPDDVKTNYGNDNSTSCYLTFYFDLMNLDPSCRYTLMIKYDGDTYSTPAMELPKSSSDIMSLTSYYNDVTKVMDVLISTTPNEKGKEEYFMSSVSEIWEINTPFKPEYEFDPNVNDIVPILRRLSRGWRYEDGLVCYYKKGSEDLSVRNHTLYSFPCEDKRFNTLYYAKVSNRQISKQEYEYYEMAQKLDDEMGGLFTPMPSENNGNITCLTNPDKKCVGYIGLQSQPSCRELYITKEEAHHSLRYDIPESEELEPEKYMSYWTYGYRVSGHTMDLLRNIHYEWNQSRWTDCTHRFWGCTTLKMPEFWPKKN